MKIHSINEKIEQASKVIGQTWPLYSFVTSNPLSGYESLPFDDALKHAEMLLGANVYPDGAVLSYAWTNGQIKERILQKQILAYGIDKNIEDCLEILLEPKKSSIQNVHEELDRQMSKWLANFMDEGQAEWSMPYREEGFYTSWKNLIVYDKNLAGILGEIPKTSLLAIQRVMENYKVEDHLDIFIHHLAALPGWVGYIKHRLHTDSEWNKKFPINLQDYLAVRLLLAEAMDLPIKNSNDPHHQTEELHKISLAFLKSWEYSFQESLIGNLKIKNDKKNEEKVKRPDAQFVFCIDTRSEQIRKHVEAIGNYETFGYAGFFGIAMDYLDDETGIKKKSCPPIVPSAYHVSEIASENREKEYEERQFSFRKRKFRNHFLTRMKNMLPSAFGFVEGAGIAYGTALLSRTLSPGILYRRKKSNEKLHESYCDPELYNAGSNQQEQIPVMDQVLILKNAFDLLGWKSFAPLVIFAGHGSHTANNAFGSSLDCGACAANPGRHNARMLARIANNKEVREILSVKFDIQIPRDTIFFAAEHNTTTDEIVLFENNSLHSHSKKLESLKSDLKEVQKNATASRLNISSGSVSLAESKANDWSDTRPEWGLARNAGFIIGPRSLTAHRDLESRCFLHSYDWRNDKTGDALEAIMQGPMTVTQWINNHYYFSTVDNDKFGGSTKIFHNITGRFGVVEGNGGDLKIGLPLQSVKMTDEKIYHEPLRLSVVIQSPLSRVQEILKNNENLMKLINNKWIHLLVLDPLKNNNVFRFRDKYTWQNMSGNKLEKEVLLSVSELAD
ncbi:DUF2309 domain-containing protein [Salegentibacter sp. HM20]